jgi:hypothetical protein
MKNMIHARIEEIQCALENNFVLEESLHLAQKALIGNRDTMLKKMGEKLMIAIFPT